MQRYCTELTERLLKSLDKEYNVVDMGAVVDVITALEKTTITKEVLEITRLGKYINELRRKTNNDALAKRAKDLVRRWRDMVLPSANTTPQPTPADPAPQALNGTKPQSPALRGLKPHSPAIRSLKPHSPALKAFKPHSPLLRDATPTKQVLSPASSLHSDHSRSPNPTPTKQHHHHHQHHHHQKPPLSHPAPTTTTASTTNHRPNTDVSPKPVLASTHNHTIEAVPRTHSSNKRLRKEDSSPAGSPPTPPSATSKSQPSETPVSRLEPSAKRQRLNGEQTSLSLSKPTEPSANSNALTGRGTSNSSSRPATFNQQVPSPRESERAIERLTEARSTVASRDIAGETLAAAPSGPKKRGRKKGSKSLKNQTLPEDRVKEKLASISRNPKLKTTQELLADLQARGSNTASLGTGSTTTLAGAHGLPSRSTEPPSTEEILRSSVGNDDRPLSSRYHWTREKTSRRASSGRDGGATNFGDSPKSRAKAASAASKRWESSRKSDDGEDSQQEHVDVDGISRTRELTVEEILAKLPPLDREAISWSDCEEEAVEEEEPAAEENGREISEEDVDRLHDQCVEGLNGNFQMKMRITSEEENDGTKKPLDDRARDERVDEIRASDEWSIADVKKKGVYRRLGGNEDDREFREWHEMLARPSYDGQILHILPYVIID